MLILQTVFATTAVPVLSKKLLKYVKRSFTLQLKKPTKDNEVRPTPKRPGFTGYILSLQKK